MHSFREDLTNDDSKDGLARDLFPLTTEEQKSYQFRLIGEETFEGRKTYHLGFTPKDSEDIEWAGEAFIDEDEFQPIYVFAGYRDAYPLECRTLLGTNLSRHRLCRSLSKAGRRCLVPTSLGSEFRIHVLFFFNRSMSISMENKNFERAHVESKIVGVNRLGMRRISSRPLLIAQILRPSLH